MLCLIDTPLHHRLPGGAAVLNLSAMCVGLHPWLPQELF